MKDRVGTQILANGARRYANYNASGVLQGYMYLLLADEPTGNLDEANQNLVMKIFRELHEEGHTIITVTHSTEVGQAAERCVVIEHGKIKKVVENKLEAI